MPSTRHINCIRFDAKSKTPHRDMIVRLAKEAVDNNHNFLSRARLESFNESPFSKERLVADFVDLTSGDVVEVAWSENDKSLEKKKKIYNKYGLNMVSVRVPKSV